MNLAAGSRVSFADNVRIRSTALTQKLGLAGLIGTWNVKMIAAARIRSKPDRGAKHGSRS